MKIKMMTITVTRDIGPEFIVYLPEKVSGLLCLLCLHTDLLWVQLYNFFMTHVEIAVDHHGPPVVCCQPAEGGDLQEHQHPPRVPEDQV